VLRRAAADADTSNADLQRARRSEWEDFYATLHEAPIVPTYRHTYAPDVEVSDRIGRWIGLDAWSTHEREAIELGVRATIIGLVASHDLTVVEIDFTNPTWAEGHCPPRSTFVHHLAAGRTQRLDIHYVTADQTAPTVAASERHRLRRRCRQLRLRSRQVAGVDPKLAAVGGVQRPSRAARHRRHHHRGSLARRRRTGADRRCRRLSRIRSERPVIARPLPENAGSRPVHAAPSIAQGDGRRWQYRRLCDAGSRGGCRQSRTPIIPVL
jgi:hypothetical protein